MDFLRQASSETLAKTNQFVPWELIVNFLNSPFVSSLLAALMGALAGALAAQRIAERSLLRKEAASGLENANKAIALCTGVCNYGLSFKKQHTRRMLEAYEADRKKVLELEDLNARGLTSPKIFMFDGDMKSLPPPTFPVDLLTSIVNELPYITARATSAANMVLDSYRQLAICVDRRNELIEQMRGIADESSRKYAEMYFGIPDSRGNVDTKFGDTLGAIAIHTDDMIFFSHLLSNDLVEHGNKLRDKLKAKGHKGEAEVLEVNWSSAEDQNLVPPRTEYQDWLAGFRSKSDTTTKKP